jgi:hypothetical protein
MQAILIRKHIMLFQNVSFNNLIYTVFLQKKVRNLLFL